jgi:hypothetical protein
MALRMLHAFLVDGNVSSHQVSLAPHLVMRGNLDFFLRRPFHESVVEKTQHSSDTSRQLAEEFV